MKRARINRREHPIENTTAISSLVLYFLRIVQFLGHIGFFALHYTSPILRITL